MSGERPINAEEPAGGKDDQGAAKGKAPAAEPPGKRSSIPRAPLALGAMVVVALGFIVAALIASGDSDPSSPKGPAPVPSGAPKAATEPTQQAASELGYPAFATANTTRIGGSDPVSNAAAAALAVFPSTRASQRPLAVTVVDSEDWQATIAAAVLMATPLRAPILLSNRDDAPSPTVDALSALDPQGGEESGGAAIFAIGQASVPEGAEKVKHLRSSGPAAAAAIAKLRDRLADGPPKHVVVAPSGQPGFAMPAAAWAARSGDPVLFADQDGLPKPTAKALERHTKVPVYVLGPSSAISSDTLRKIAKIAPRVHRVSGEDPVSNAIAFARYGDGDFGWNINDPGHGFVVTRSDSPLDAAAATPLAAAGTWGPLLLTDGAANLPPALRDYLLDVKPGYTDDPTRAFYNHVWVIGDQAAIEVAQQAEINELAELAKIGAAGE